MGRNTRRNSGGSNANPASTPDQIKAADLAALVGRHYLRRRPGTDRRRHRLVRQDQHHEHGRHQASSCGDRYQLQDASSRYRHGDNYQTGAYPNRNCDGPAATGAARVAVIVGSRGSRGSISDSRFVLSAQQ